MTGLLKMLHKIIDVIKPDPKPARESEIELKRAVDEHAEKHMQAIKHAQAARVRMWDEVHHAESVAAGGKRK